LLHRTGLQAYPQAPLVSPLQRKADFAPPRPRGYSCEAEEPALGLRGVAAGNTYHITNHDHDALNREVLIVSTDLMLEDVGIHSGGTQQYTCRV
ncbi:hypothetical protein Q6324_27620, partial [Klebsiella pneumoniae]|nr:hypothetical protein [Klebsiella pneumoniae]